MLDIIFLAFEAALFVTACIAALIFMWGGIAMAIRYLKNMNNKE